MLGFRKTVGSVEIAYPSLDELRIGFNKQHTVMSEE